MGDPLFVVGLGHPLLDVSTHVGADFLAMFNVGPGQTMLATPEQLPVYQEIARHDDVEYVPGGATMNAVRVCRWLSEANTCSYVGTIGDDEFGRILETSLEKCGVTPVLEKQPQHPTVYSVSPALPSRTARHPHPPLSPGFVCVFNRRQGKVPDCQPGCRRAVLYGSFQLSSGATSDRRGRHLLRRRVLPQHGEQPRSAYVDRQALRRPQQGVRDEPVGAVPVRVVQRHVERHHALRRLPLREQERRPCLQSGTGLGVHR